MRKTCVRPPQRNHHQRATNETTAKLQLNFLGRWNARISIKQADSMPKAYDANNDEDGDMQLYMVKRANLTETIIIQLEPHPYAAATSPPPPSMASFQSIISNVSEPRHCCASHTQPILLRDPNGQQPTTTNSKNLLIPSLLLLIHLAICVNTETGASSIDDNSRQTGTNSYPSFVVFLNQLSPP